MPLFPATKLMDTVIGVDVHAVTPIPGIPVHPYVGPIYLWCDPAFPKSNVFINGMPAMTVGSMGYFAHVPQGVPVNPPNLPYWKRYLSNVAMGMVLMGLTTLANIAIAGISALIPKPPEAEAFLKDVTGIDTSSKAAAWESVKGAFAAFTQWPTWVKLLMPPIPYPGAQGSVAVGSPNVTVNGGPLGFVAPLVATSCSDIPVVPNAMTLGFSNVMVGVSFAALLRGIAVSAAQNAVAAGVGKGVQAAQNRRQQSQNPRCGRPGEPIDPVTGAVESEWVDVLAPEAPEWRLERAYSSAWAAEDGPFGFGHRAGFQHGLLLLESGEVVYEDARKRLFPFSPDAEGRFPEGFGGYTLEQYDRNRYILRHPRHGAFGFERMIADAGRARLTMLKCRGVHHAFAYDEHGRLVALRQTVAGRRQQVADTRFRYDAAGHLVEVLRGAAGELPRSVARYDYDRVGNLTAWIDAEGRRTAYRYDRAHRMLQLTDRRGYSFRYAYDRQGRCVESQGDDGLWKIALRYGPDRSFVTEGDGGMWVYVFDELGTIREIIDPYGGVTRREVGADGQVVAETDSGGRRAQWLHDPDGHHHARLDEWGLLWPPMDDAPVLRNPLAHRVPRTAYAREWGKVFASADPAMRLPVPAGVAALLAASRPAPSAEPALVYDQQGRLVQRTDTDGRTERFAHDAEGNVVERIDADGAAWRFEHRSWNLVGAEIDPLGNVTRFRHNLRQHIAAISDGAGNVTRYDYDHKDRVARYVLHGQVQESYLYDAGDRVLERRDGEGRLLLRYAIGANGLHSARELASGGAHRFAYDAAGRFTEASTSRHEVRFAYAAGGRSADLRDGIGITHAFEGGRLASTGYLGRFLVRYVPDAVGGATLETPDGGIHRIQCGDAGGTLRMLANGAREASAYDADGRCVARLRWRDNRPADIDAERYAYSASGELRRAGDSSGAERRFTYDAAHRLTGAQPRRGASVAYAYDAAGNLIQGPKGLAFEVGAGNRLLRAGDWRFTYDGRGRLAERIGPDGRVTRYGYDSLDLLVEVSWSDREDVWQGEYDGLCRLIASRCGARRSAFFWDGDRLAAEQAEDGGLRLYVYPSAETFLPLLFIDYASAEAPAESGRAYYPFHDQIGLPQWIEDDRGAVVWRAEATDAYGLIEVAPESRLTYRLRFPGHMLIAETGLHANRFRSYDPALGRYLQPDPSGQRGGINLYAYDGNPLARVDLLGLHADDHAPKSAAAGEGNEQAGPAGARPPGPDGAAPEPNGWPPPRTAQAQSEAQKVVDTMEGLGMSKKENKVVDVLTHENGTVSVGLSGEGSPRQQERAQKVQDALNNGDPNGPYRVTTDNTVPGIQQVEGGNAPGACAEPSAASAARDNPSPVTGNDTRWRGKGDNPHPFTGENADGAPTAPNQMDPCNTCGDPQNSNAYGEHANG